MIRASILVGSICIDSSISQNTGVAPERTIATEVATNPVAGQMTSVPGPAPRPTRAAWSEPVPELTPCAWLTPKNFLANAS